MELHDDRWSVEQLRGLRDLEMTFPEGHLCLFPIIQDWGRNIKWDARIYVKGAAGVLRPSIESLQSVGCPNPSEVLDKTNYALGALQRIYPSIEAGIEKRLEAIQARVKQLEGGAAALASEREF